MWQYIPIPSSRPLLTSGSPEKSGRRRKRKVMSYIDPISTRTRSQNSIEVERGKLFTIGLNMFAPVRKKRTNTDSTSSGEGLLRLRDKGEEEEGEGSMEVQDSVGKVDANKDSEAEDEESMWLSAEDAKIKKKPAENVSDESDSDSSSSSSSSDDSDSDSDSTSSSSSDTSSEATSTENTADPLPSNKAPDSDLDSEDEPAAQEVDTRLSEERSDVPFRKTYTSDVEEFDSGTESEDEDSARKDDPDDKTDGKKKEKGNNIEDVTIKEPEEVHVVEASNQPESKTASPTTVAPSPVPSIAVHSPMPSLAVHSPNMAVHSPHMTGHSPNMAVHSPNMAVHSPNMVVHSPNMAVHSPNMVVHSPNMVVHSPNMAVLSPAVSPVPPTASPRGMPLLNPISSQTIPPISIASQDNVPHPPSTAANLLLPPIHPTQPMLRIPQLPFRRAYTPDPSSIDTSTPPTTASSFSVTYPVSLAIPSLSSSSSQPSLSSQFPYGSMYQQYLQLFQRQHLLKSQPSSLLAATTTPHALTSSSTPMLQNSATPLLSSMPYLSPYHMAAAYRPPGLPQLTPLTSRPLAQQYQWTPSGPRLHGVGPHQPPKLQGPPSVDPNSPNTTSSSQQ